MCKTSYKDEEDLEIGKISKPSPGIDTRPEDEKKASDLLDWSDPGDQEDQKEYQALAKRLA